MDEVLSNLRNVFKQEKRETQGDLIEKDVMLTIETLPGSQAQDFYSVRWSVTAKNEGLMCRSPAFHHLANLTTATSYSFKTNRLSVSAYLPGACEPVAWSTYSSCAPRLVGSYPRSSGRAC
jgi:hypothetical protein